MWWFQMEYENYTELSSECILENKQTWAAVM